MRKKNTEIEIFAMIKKIVCINIEKAVKLSFFFAHLNTLVTYYYQYLFMHCAKPGRWFGDFMALFRINSSHS